MNDSPLLELARPLRFHEVHAAHVEPAIDALIARAKEHLVAISEGRDADVISAFDRATEALDDASAFVSHVESVATTADWRAAYNAIQPKLSAFYASIVLDAPLYAALRAFASSDRASALDAPRARLLGKALRDFERNGAALDASGKARLEALAVRLGDATTRYAQNVLDATNAFELLVHDEARLAGLPPSARALARQSAKNKGLEGHRFTLQAPSLLPVLSHADDAELRRALWHASVVRASSGVHDNRALVAEILGLRREKAALLGYGDFADLVLADRMAGQGSAAVAFVRDLEERTRPFFERECAELAEYRRSIEGADAPELRPWDVAYYAEKLRKARFDFDDEALRPYFQLDRVLGGMFDLATRLYGVRVRPAPEMPKWDDAVRTYELVDERGARLGAFYVDLFPRENKRDGAWMSPLHTAMSEGDLHVAQMAANFSPPTDGRPVLLLHREVETLFHEFGHLLHHLLTRVPVRSLAGTNVAWDFVELPSQIMENFCWERASLDLFARHHETGAPLPDALLDKLRAARTFRSASAQMRQLGLASVDLALHVDFDPSAHLDAFDFARVVMQRFSATPIPEEYAQIASFGHLFADATGYAAGYYSYKWAEVLDADAFTRFFADGVLSRSVGDHFRDTVLSRGDSEDPGVLFERFMGRAPRLEALLERSGLSARAA